MEDSNTPPVISPDLQAVISRVPFLADATELTAEHLPGGLTNTTFLVSADGVQYVVRVAGDDVGLLGIDRAREAGVVQIAANAGIAPEPLAFLLPEGHAVTRFLGDARSFSVEEFTAPGTIMRVAARLRDIHALPAVAGVFDPHADIKRWLPVITSDGTPRPARLDALVEKVAALQPEWPGVARSVLCHNDPYFLNFLDDGALWVIDWEYAGMGDPLYDLAGVGYTLDAAGRDLLLESYFGSVDPETRRGLDRMICVFLCWNVAWSLLQATRSSIDFDFSAFAEELLDLVPDIAGGI